MSEDASNRNDDSSNPQDSGCWNNDSGSSTKQQREREQQNIQKGVRFDIPTVAPSSKNMESAHHFKSESVPGRWCRGDEKWKDRRFVGAVGLRRRAPTVLAVDDVVVTAAAETAW